MTRESVPIRAVEQKGKKKSKSRKLREINKNDRPELSNSPLGKFVIAASHISGRKMPSFIPSLSQIQTHVSVAHGFSTKVVNTVFVDDGGGGGGGGTG